MFKKLLLFFAAAVALIAVTVLVKCGTRASSPAQAELDIKFSTMMNGVALVGRSSRTNSDKISGEERYVIQSVTKIGAETWLFKARFQYEGHDLPIPIPVIIKWAGDTPVITLTDLAIPGMGSYTARVVLSGDQYAGTWSGKNGGGQLFGKIAKLSQ